MRVLTSFSKAFDKVFLSIRIPFVDDSLAADEFSSFSFVTQSEKTFVKCSSCSEVLHNDFGN